MWKGRNKYFITFKLTLYLNISTGSFLSEPLNFFSHMKGCVGRGMIDVFKGFTVSGKASLFQDFSLQLPLLTCLI